jgi:hypothetical protein
MSRSVTARVHFEPDRSMRVVIQGPAGTIDAGTTRRSADLWRIAKEAVRALSGPGPSDVEVLVDQPPWLREGMIVQPVADQIDPDEGTTHPYAQVVGFLPVGGVMIVHPETGAGVYAPEHLTVIDPMSLDQDILAGIVQRTGIAAYRN